MAMKAMHVSSGVLEPTEARWPVGIPFVYQSSVWRINGLYLTVTPSGKREAWWILAERPNEGKQVDEEGGR